MTKPLKEKCQGSLSCLCPDCVPRTKETTVHETVIITKYSRKALLRALGFADHANASLEVEVTEVDGYDDSLVTRAVEGDLIVTVKHYKREET